MNNIADIQAKLREKELDAVLIYDGRNQRYATGFNFSDGAVLVSAEKAWLITDSRYIEAAEAAAPDCVTVQMFDGKTSQLSLVRAALEEAGIKKLGCEENRLSYAHYMSLEKELGMSLLPAQSIFSELRRSKKAHEIESMKKAQRISEKALEEVLHIIKPGMTERQVAAELVYHMLRNGSEGNSFDPIVVSGAKTSLPHGEPEDKLICHGDFVTMDFGCIVDGYCSDMTRTVAVGQATEEMRNVYSVVLEAQLAGIAAARAGIPGREIDAAARNVIKNAGYGEYFGHSFGHSLGLNIHEEPNASPSCSELMPEGAVISAEPGIYLPGKFGVRIEDVLVLQRDGCQVITKAPKELIIL